MGVLRFLLAMGVAAEHANAPLWIGSYSAVQAFFMISGFYMALIFGNRYYSTRDFYISRFIRLFPMYWIVAMLALGVYALALWGGIMHPKFDQLAQIGTNGVAVAAWGVVANATMLTSDWSWFLSPAAVGGNHGTSLLLIPPVWTLGLELVFYALCPWLMRLSSAKLFVLLSLSVLARIYGYYHGLNDNPWHARFFGFELAFFLLGILACRVYRYLGENFFQRPLQRRLGWLAVVGMIGFSIFFIPINEYVGITLYGRSDFGLSLIYYIALFTTLPYIFDVTKRFKFDRYVGEYSYPIYLLHYIFVIVFVHTGYAGPAAGARLVLVLGSTCVLSAVLIHSVQIPVDRWRHRIAHATDDRASD